MLADDEVEMATQVIMAEGPFMGEVLAFLGRAKGRKTISRFDLLNAFSGLIPKDRINFNKRLERIEESPDGSGVTAHFEDGSSATGDCIISGDGIHSKTRHFLIGADHPAANPVNHDDWLMISRQVPAEHAFKVLSDKWTSFVPIIIGPEGYINMMPLRKGETWSVALVVTGEATQENVDAWLDGSRFKNYDPEVLKIISLLRDAPGQFTYWNLMDHDRAPVFYRRNVAMIGDAAHATMPFIGNGAAQAIEDSAVLHAIFKEVHTKQQIELAFEAYKKVRKERSQMVVEASRECGRIDRYMVDEIPGADPYTREGVDAIKRRYQEIGKFTNEVDVGEQNAAAVKVFRELKYMFYKT